MCNVWLSRPKAQPLSPQWAPLLGPIRPIPRQAVSSLGMLPPQLVPRGKGLAGPVHLLWSWPAPKACLQLSEVPKSLFLYGPSMDKHEYIKPLIWASHTQRTNMCSKSTYRSGARRAELEGIKMARDPAGEPVLGTVYKAKFAHDQQPGQLQECWQ